MLDSQLTPCELVDSTVPTDVSTLDSQPKIKNEVFSLDPKHDHLTTDIYASNLSNAILLCDSINKNPTTSPPLVSQTLSPIKNKTNIGKVHNFASICPGGFSGTSGFLHSSSSCFTELQIPPGTAALLRKSLDAQHLARQAFELHVTESDAEEGGRRLCVELLLLQQARRATLIDVEQVALQQSARFLEEIAIAVRERRTSLVPDGYQAFLFPNGDVYEGNWKNCLLHGKGSLIRAATREVYEGQWFLGHRCGTGTLSSPGYRTIYSGAWLDNKRHGRGELVEPEGIYVGEFINNHLSGYGEYTYYDGRVYRGHWRDGLFEGNGVYICRSGSRYEGGWSAGYENGRGTKFFFNGDIYIGDWVKGRRHGYGIYKSPFFHYEGSWAYDNMCGSGVCVFEDKSSYNGQWDRGLFHGKGCFRASPEAGGATYFGEFVHGKRHGRGKFVKSSGATIVEYDGEWWEDEKDGVGFLKGSGCGVYDGVWSHGEPVGDGGDSMNDDFNYLPSSNNSNPSYDFREGKKQGSMTSAATVGNRFQCITISNAYKLRLNLSSS
ncbi:unnamed protein product [Phytomonas sp. Hart1]|nr:unnamed protein product [Phytomonas sp. Hart1]|eukprot:CCW66327.1 unnamed protein product [Phytomonas sp. isolate Hart1]